MSSKSFLAGPSSNWGWLTLDKQALLAKFHNLNWNRWNILLQSKCLIKNYLIWYSNRNFPIFQIKTTDLGSLIARHNLEISGFFCLSDFTQNWFWSFWSQKTAILTIWADLDFEFLNISDIFKSEVFLKIKIENLQNCWNGSFSPSDISKNWFHVKLPKIGRKIAKFSLCQKSTVKIPN